MVLPYAINLQKLEGYPLAADAQFLHHPERSSVPRNDRDLDAVQAELLEREGQRHHHRLGDVALPGFRLVDPVTHEGALERSALDGGHGELTDQASPHEDPEPKASAQLAFALAH